MYIYILYIYIYTHIILYAYTYYLYEYSIIYMVFTTEGLFEVVIENWPKWYLKPLPLNSVQTL